MQKTRGKFILIMLLLMFVGLSLSAAIEKISIPFQVKNFTQGSVRYQVNSESPMGWTILSADNLNITFETDDRTTDTIYVQQQGKSGTWSPSSMLVWDEASDSWIMLHGLKADSIDGAEKIEIPFQIKNFAQGNIRYQVNNESAKGWTILSKDNMIIKFHTEDKIKDIVYVQQQGKSGKWSPSSMLVWDKASASWVTKRVAQIKETPATLPVQDTKVVEKYLSLAAEPILSIPLTEVKDTYYTIGYGVEISLGWHYGKNAIISDVFYQLRTPKNIAVDIIHEGGLALSYAYQFEREAIKVQPEIGVGLILHAAYRGGKLLGFYYDPYVVGGVMLSTRMAENIDLFIRGRVLVYVWKESLLMFNGIVGAGISIRL